MGLAFDFKPNGDCEFYMATGGTNIGCRTESFIYKKGTVQFYDKNSFTFYPTKGNLRGFSRGCAAAYDDYDRKAEGKDLEPQTYYFTLQQDSNGRDQLITRFEENSTSGTTFQVANW